MLGALGCLSMGTEMKRLVLTALGLACALPAAIAVQTAELPLELGFYVRTDDTCATANAASTALLRPQGLQWVTSYCLFDAIAQTGPTTFAVTQSCGDALAGLETAEAVYEIPDNTSFSLVDSHGWEHAARYCPQGEMPEPWRSQDIGDIYD